MLPDGSGIELVQVIKNLYPHIPCILETAKFQIEDKIE
jgi:DNA-binding response OmpR family regulator